MLFVEGEDLKHEYCVQLRQPALPISKANDFPQHQVLLFTHPLIKFRLLLE
jgi:hypothetical protein